MMSIKTIGLPVIGTPMILGLVVFQIIVHELGSKDGQKNCPYAWTLELSSTETCTLFSLSGLVLPTGNE